MISSSPIRVSLVGVPAECSCRRLRFPHVDEWGIMGGQDNVVNMDPGVMAMLQKSVSFKLCEEAYMDVVVNLPQPLHMTPGRKSVLPLWQHSVRNLSLKGEAKQQSVYRYLYNFQVWWLIRCAWSQEWAIKGCCYRSLQPAWIFHKTSFC